MGLALWAGLWYTTGYKQALRGKEEGLFTKRTLLRSLAVLAVLGLVGAACSKKTSSSTTTKTVKLAYMGALTGPNAQLVLPGFNAVKLAASQANGGKFGTLPVKIVVEGEDTQGSPTVIPPLATKVANDQTFVGVIGPAFSGESAAGGPTLDGAGIPFVTGSATNPTLSTNGWTHWFRAQANDNSQGPTAADYITKVLKPACAVVSSDDSTYGKGLAQIVQQRLTTAGLQVTAELGAVTTGDKTFDPLIGKVKSSGCKVLFYGGYTAEASPLRQQMTSAGLTDVTLIGGDGIKDKTIQFQPNHELVSEDVKIYFYKDNGSTWDYLGEATTVTGG